MTPEDVFLEDIRKHPDDDTLRLIFADWLDDNGDPQRADFIRTQIQYHRPDTDPDMKGELRRGAEQLLQPNWNKWVGPLARIIGPNTPSLNWPLRRYHAAYWSRFPRGFVEELEIDSEQLVNHADDLFRRYPIRHFLLHRAGDQAARLAQCRQLAWVETLTFSDYCRAPLDNRSLAQLADGPLFQRLWRLGLYNNHVGDDGVIALARACWLPGVGHLILDNNSFSERGIEILAWTSLEFRPTRLSLSGNYIGENGGVALANSLILRQVRTLILRKCSLGPATASALARSPYLEHLEELDLTSNDLGRQGQRALEKAPWRWRLRNLLI